MAYCQSYTPDYFALNDILSTEERVSCKIEIELLLKNKKGKKKVTRLRIHDKRIFNNRVGYKRV